MAHVAQIALDIDNRSGQETGYLFEPVLASCMGGTTIKSRNSPVKRVDESGRQTVEGRQIDCLDVDAKIAYEFKLRVTIASSGQGRFAEELSFPVECKAAGLTPVLLVLDPTPSARLAELQKAFEANGGEAHVADAWGFIEDKAGKCMSIFIENYLRPVLLQMAAFNNKLPDTLTLTWSKENITFRFWAKRCSILGEKKTANDEVRRIPYLYGSEKVTWSMKSGPQVSSYLEAGRSCSKNAHGILNKCEPWLIPKHEDPFHGYRSNPIHQREVERELWARAAGRCQFDGCNRPLFKSPVTQEQVNISEKAHIYSFSENGPRGWGPFITNKSNSTSWRTSCWCATTATRRLTRTRKESDTRRICCQVEG